MENMMVVGYDDEGNEILGAFPRRGRTSRPSFGRGMGMASRMPSFRPVTRNPAMIAPHNTFLNAVPGSPGSAIGGSAVNTPVATFTNTSGTVLTVISRPQKAFIGRRVVANVNRADSAGVAIPGNPVFLNQLLVGVDSQFVSSDPIDLQALAVNATGAGFSLNATQPGLEYSAVFSIAGVALGATQSIAVSLTIYGDLIR